MAATDWDKGTITPPAGTVDWDQGEMSPPVQPAGVLRKVGDLGISALRGAVALPEAAVGVADIATGGRAGKFLENAEGNYGFRPKQATEALSEFYSDDYKAKQKAFQDADGVVDKTVQAVTNPSLIANAAVESLPSMIGGAGVARGLLKVAPKIGAVAAGAAGEGAVGAGSASEQIRQETADGTLTPGQAALALGSGAATGALGFAGGKVAQKLGIADVDTALARGTLTVPGQTAKAAEKGVARRAGEGFVSEGLLEELPQSLSEQGFQNVALDKPLTEGMTDAGVMGTLTGGVVGAGAGGAGHGPARPKPEVLPDGRPAPTAPEGMALAPDVAPAAPAPVLGPKEPTTVVRAFDPANPDAPQRLGLVPEPDPNGVEFQPEPVKTRAEEAGIDASAGPLSASAAMSLNSGLTDSMQAQAAAAAQAEQAGAAGKDQSSADPAQAGDTTGPTNPSSPGTGQPAQRIDQPPVGSTQGPVEDQGVPSPDATPAPGTFATYEDAKGYIANQRRAGGTPMPALPMPRPDGSFGLAMKGTPDYTIAQFDQKQRKLRAAGVLDGDILTKSGDLFTKKGVAVINAKRAGDGFIVAPVQGGFVVRQAAPITTAPATPDQVAAQAAAAPAVQPVASSAPVQVDAAVDTAPAVAQNAAPTETSNEAATPQAQGQEAAPVASDRPDAPENVPPDAGRVDAAPAASSRSNEDLQRQQQEPAGNQEIVGQSRAAPVGDDTTSTSDDGTNSAAAADGTKQVDSAAAPAPDDGILIKEGKGFAKGKYLAEIAEDRSGVPGGPYNTADEARAAAVKWREKLAKNASDTAESRERLNKRAQALRDGRAADVSDLQALGLRPGRSDLKWFIPAAADFFGIGSRDVRPLVKDLVRVGTTDMGAKRESVDPVKALDATAKSQAASKAEAKPEVASKAEKPAKRLNKVQQAQADAEAARAKHFTPGNVIRSYGGFDEVIAYNAPTKPGGAWSVTVQDVKKVDGKWVRQGKAHDTRTHTTDPDARALKQGPIAHLKPQAAAAVEYSEPRQDGAAPPNAPARGAESAPRETQNDPIARLEAIAKRLDVQVSRSGGGWHATGDSVTIPDGDVDSQKFVAPGRVFAHELGHVVMKKRQTSFKGFPVSELKKWASNWSDLVAASKAFRPDVHSHENVRFRRHALKPDEILADAIGSVLIGKQPVSLLQPLMDRLGWTERDLGLDSLKPDGNVPLSRSAPSLEAERALDEDDHHTEVKRTVAAIRDGWKNAPPVLVARDATDPRLPQRLRDYYAAPGAITPNGSYFGGTVYLFSDHIADTREATTVLFHEALGHHGLRGVFGDQLNGILDNLASARRSDIEAKAVEYGLDASTDFGRRRAAEEVLSEMAETNPRLPWVRQAIAAIRTWLRENVPSLNTLAMTNDEIVRNFLAPARGFVERGPAAEALPTAAVPASSSGETPASSITTSEFKTKALDAFHTIANAPGKLSWWHKTIGTQYNLAQRSKPFKRVFDSVQSFIGDVSRYATEAADLAPKILPKLESIADIRKSPISAADNKAIAAPIFEGTLVWARDEKGTPTKVKDLESAAEKMSVQDKAQQMLRAGKVAPEVLQMWQGLPVDQYNTIIDGKYERDMLSAGVVWSDPELRSMFKMSDAQIALYREFRAATDKSLASLSTSDMLRYAGNDAAAVRSMVLDAANEQDAAVLLRDHLLQLANEQPGRAEVLRDTANGVIAKADQARDLKARGYAPLSRFGHYTVDVVTTTGERQYFGMFESRFEAARMAAKMKQEFPGAVIQQGTVSQEEYKLFAGVSPETLELFGSMVGLEDNTMFQQYLKLAKTSRSAMKRLIERKGIAGFSEEAGRVLAGFVYSNARQTASNLHMGEMKDAAAAVEKGAGELKDAAVKLVDYVSTPQEEGQAIRGLLFAQYLGGSVASAMVNLTQTVAMTFPYLSQFGGVVKAGNQVRRAAADALKKTTGDAKLDEELKAAEARGTVAPQEVHQLMAQAAGKGSLRSGDGTKVGDAWAATNNASARFMLAWGKLFSAAEQFNRRATFIAAYRTAVAQGIDNPAAFADNAIAETQGVYNKGNKPAWARGAVGGTIFTFKQFGISYIEMLHRLATRNGPEGRKAAALMLGVLFLMSGAGGLPFEEDLEDLIDGLMQRLGYSFSAKASRQQFLIDTFGKAGADFIDRGVSGIAGVPIDVSGRLGVGNLLPGTGLLTKKTDYSRDMLELAGPAGDLIKRGFQGVGKVVDGNSGAALGQVLPTAARNLAKAHDMATTGMYRDDRGRKVIDTDGFDALAKAIGFQPNDVAKVQEATGTQQGLIAQVKMRETEIADAWAQGVFEKDPEKVQNARDMLNRWNENNPAAPIKITPGQIFKRVRAMNESKETRIAKTAPAEIRSAVRRELADAR